jgi:hypothetical protein
MICRFAMSISETDCQEWRMGRKAAERSECLRESNVESSDTEIAEE